MSDEFNPILTDRPFKREWKFKTSRSSGKGGQHVNKVETKVELLFNIRESLLLSEKEKKLILESLLTKIDQDGILHIVSEDARTQQTNKKHVIIKFFLMMEDALFEYPERVPTKPSKSIKEKMLKEKKKRGEIKKLRRKSIDEE